LIYLLSIFRIVGIGFEVLLALATLSCGTFL